MTSPLHPLLSPPLSTLLSVLPPSTLSTLSRLPPLRLSRTALPHISTIELVSAASFPAYIPLYSASFPKPTERERPDLIVDRLLAQSSGLRAGRAPYRIVGLRDHEDRVIGAAQFSVLPLRGTGVVVPYLQYIYVRAASRRLDMAEVLHLLVAAVGMADAVGMVSSSSSSSASLKGTGTGTGTGTGMGLDVPIVPFTLFETDPPDHGEDEESRAYASQRVKIHARGGAVALMLRYTCSGSLEEGGRVRDGEGGESVVSPHIQPGLEVGEVPVPLVWVVRPVGGFEVPKRWFGMGQEEGEREGEVVGEMMDLEVIGDAVITAYYQGLLDEGFPAANVMLAKEMYERRRKGRGFFVMPLEEVTEEMLHG